ncbi:MAG: WbqC family protein [Elusimicrobiota bacterium]
MILSVHQPQYMPWLGYFHKIAKSDVFVFLDDVQYKKREFQNRNKIKTRNGWLWLTVPIVSKSRYMQKIAEVEIDNDAGWANDHIKTIEHSYAAAPFFTGHHGFFSELLNKKWTTLMDLNVETVRYLTGCFDIKTPVHFSSGLNLETTSTQRIIDICKNFGADTYLSGAGGMNYMDEGLFEKNGIKLVYQKFVHPEYRQCFGTFLPFMSAIDLLFNCGNESRDIIMRGGVTIH